MGLLLPIPECHKDLLLLPELREDSSPLCKYPKSFFFSLPLCQVLSLPLSEDQKVLFHQHEC